MKCRDEPVATDTVHSDTLAIDNGSTSTQIFARTKTLVTNVYGIKSNKKFVNALEDNIRTWGLMSKLISDRDQYEASNCAKKFLDLCSLTTGKVSPIDIFKIL